MDCSKLLPVILIVTVISAKTSTTVVDRLIKLRKDSFFKLGYTLSQSVDQTKSKNCWTISFPVKIRPLGCKPLIFKNKYCTGYCTSYYIPPQGSKRSKDESCNVCKPSRDGVKIQTVDLDCIESHGNRIRSVTKQMNISVITKCECGSCTMYD